MAEYGTDSIQAIVNLYSRFNGKDKTQFLEYKDKLRVSLSFHRQSVAAILQGEPKPTTAQNSPAVTTWTRANENLFGILFFTTELSAHNVVKRHMGKTREDGVGNGQAAWNALEKKYNNNTKETRRAYHEYLHNAKMKSGDDPDDFLYTMDGYRERLKDMGQPVPDERYEDIILQALPAEYERVRTASYERRDFHLAYSAYDECPVHRLPFPSEQLPLGSGSWGCHAGDWGRQQHHQVPLVRKSGTTREKLCRLDSGPVQRRKSANGSFNTVRALEKESRRR